MKPLSIALGLVTLLFSAWSAAATTYTYDDLNRLVAVAYDNGAKQTYSYDAGGNRLSIATTPPPGVGSTTTSTASTTSTTSTTITTVSGTTTTTQTGSSGTLNLVAGWNLVGNSSTGSLDVATVIGDTANVTTVWKWIANSTKWAFYAPALVGQALSDYAAGKGYDVLTTINGGEGFWVNAKTPFTAQLPAGTAITSTSFQSMASGWNLIAIGESKTPSQFNALAAATTPLTTLWTWDAVQANWYFYSPSLEAKGGTALTDYITSKGYLDFTANNKLLGPGVGFWVNKP